MRSRFVGSAVLSATAILAGLGTQAATGQVTTKANWIWFDDGNPLPSAPNETVYFRKTFDENYELQEAEIHITCDNTFELFINGKRVGGSEDWRNGRVFDVKPFLQQGRNTIGVVASNQGGPAGLVAWLVRLTKPGNHYTVVSDASWKCSREAAANWRESQFDDSKWPPAKVLAEFGRPEHWAGITWNGKSDASRFVVQEGFAIDQVADADVTGSIVNMTFDWKGRPVVSRERGPVLILEDEDGDGKCEKAKALSEDVKNCQGILCFDRQTYYLIGDGPKGTGSID